MKRIIFVILICLALLVFGSEQAQAAVGVEVFPKIIDEKAQARDILEYTIRLKSSRETQASLYPILNDLSIENGKEEYTEPALLDRTTSLASWLWIKRSEIELAPGAEMEIPLTIKVNLNAIPGKRHAVITFAEGSNQPEAKGHARSGNNPTVTINLEIEEDIVEKAQVKEFITNKNIYFDFPINFNLTIKNIGSSNIKPQGYIYIYNRRGEEVNKISISQDQKTIIPDTVMHFPNSWEAQQGLGKYRAKLEVEYGNKTKRDLQDTIYFWILPWRFLALIAGGAFLLIIAFSIILFKKTYHRAHPSTMAPDGVINLKGKK